MVTAVKGNNGSHPLIGHNDKNYTVRSGDSLWAIAQHHGVSLSAVIKANPQIENPNLIFPGQQIHIPGSEQKGSLGGLPVSHGPQPSERPAHPQTVGNNSYRVRQGDCLSEIAWRHGVSLHSLIAANPQIKNPNLIYPGEEIHLPGGHGDGNGPRPVGPRPVGPSPDPAPRGNGGEAAFQNAREVLGQNISWLKYHGPLAQYLDKWPGNNVSCANFVSACLQKAGEINHSEHNDNVGGLAANLRSDRRWSETSLRNARPGDVVCFNVPGEGPMSHVVMFAGWRNGEPTFIGSNNVNSDGSQRITEGYMGYPIGAVFHFHG